jgi:hypothetical protein
MGRLAVLHPCRRSGYARAARSVPRGRATPLRPVHSGCGAHYQLHEGKRENTSALAAAPCLTPADDGARANKNLQLPPNSAVQLSPGLSKITPLGLRGSFLGCTAKLSRLACSAHLRHLSAIPLHVALLCGSVVNLAISSHSAACLRNSSGACIRGPPHSSVQPHNPDERREVPGDPKFPAKKTRQEI